MVSTVSSVCVFTDQRDYRIKGNGVIFTPLSRIFLSMMLPYYPLEVFLETENYKNLLISPVRQDRLNILAF